MHDPIALPGSIPTSAAPPPVNRIDFVNEGGTFLRMLARGALLLLVTFGFYRFWLSTSIRRHLWSRTSVAGENFEYTGTGRELLIGFLFALAILVPIYIVYFLIGIEFERLRAFTSLPLVLFMAIFGQFAIYRARRYRLTRTVWRGVRFWMSGSGWVYGLRAFGMQILVALSIGLAYPWYAAWRERYKMRHTFYGDAPGAFEGRAGQLFRRGIGMWMMTIGMALVFMIAAIAMSAANGFSHLPRSGGTILGVLIALWLIAAPFVYPYLKALEWRWWAQGVRIGGVSMQSSLRGGQLLKIYLKILGWVLLVLIGWGVLAGVVAGLFYVSFGEFKSFADLPLGAKIASGIAIVAGYLLLGLTIGVVQRFYSQHEVWRAVVGSLTIQGVASLDGVAARGEAANALGEGLADGLDVAGF
ncbi:DUF898 family protein [Roseiarcaceae bacterium H3SJ34-1]|uniref:YjgN family protein n=1 Tax=Terripilifer ovatus TaxID=3032367 RepID=UPI003AB91D11|nr:DUF898 family protein [Roseiarcaceae bacterium H3SJ34-1]